MFVAIAIMIGVKVQRVEVHHLNQKKTKKRNEMYNFIEFI